MKLLAPSLFLFFQFISVTLVAQDFVSLHRGLANQVELGEFADSSRYSYACSSCEVLWRKVSGESVPKGNLLLRPSANTSSITLLVRVKATKEVVKTYTYRLTNQPDMILLLDDVPMGEAILSPPVRIVAAYPKVTGLSAQGLVTNWEMSIPASNGKGAQGFSGVNGELGAEVSQVIANLPSGSTIAMIVTVVNQEDRITRKYAGTWKTP